MRANDAADAGDAGSCGDDAQLLDVYVIGRSRSEPELFVVAPLVPERKSCFDVALDGRAVAVWCFIWVERGRFVKPLGFAPSKEVWPLYRFLITGEGAEPLGPKLAEEDARALLLRSRAFVWRGHPETWAL